MSFLNWKSVKENVPESMFLRMVHPSYYLGVTQRTTGAPRASDSSIYYKQNPVGWMFYTKTNIAELLSQVKKINPNLTFEDIQHDMEYVYNTMGRETTNDPARPLVVTSRVQALNKEVVYIATNRLQQKQNSMQRYGTYMQNPNFMASNPLYLKQGKERTIALVSGHENVPQGGNFISQTQAGTYNPPTIQPLTRYV